MCTWVHPLLYHTGFTKSGGSPQLPFPSWSCLHCRYYTEYSITHCFPTKLDRVRAVKWGLISVCIYRQKQGDYQDDANKERLCRTVFKKPLSWIKNITPFLKKMWAPPAPTKFWQQAFSLPPAWPGLNAGSRLRCYCFCLATMFGQICISLFLKKRFWCYLRRLHFSNCCFFTSLYTFCIQCNCYLSLHILADIVPQHLRLNSFDFKKHINIAFRFR